MANLTVIQGLDRGKVYDLSGKRILLGRDPRCDVALTDSSVSRRHAELRVEDGKFLLVDLNSSNGTFVNGIRAADAAVRPGDQIRLGGVILALGRLVSGPTLRGKGPVRIDEEGNAVDAAIQATAPSNIDPSMVIEDRVEDAAQARRLVDNLRILFRFSAAINHILSTQQLLDTVMEMVFDVVDADRAFILLQNESTGGMEPMAVRYRDEVISEIEATRSGRAAEPDKTQKPPILVSKTIVNYCVDRSEGVLSTNAMQDRRFEEGDSVQDLGIRSAICVPIKARDKVLGVIHVDTQLQQAPFNENDLRVMTVIGVLTGLALANTRLVELALQRERLAAVGEAVASLSHYIKNILQGLQGGSTILERGLRDNRLEHMTRGWEIVSRNQRRINDLVLDMLHYSRKREPNFERHSLNAVVREAIELIAPRAAEKQIAIVQKLDADLPEIWFDPAGIHHACLNILVNAVDAVEPRSGRVTITTSRYSGAPRNPRQTRPEELLAINISDNGAGISESELERIFQAFHSTKGHQGTGLGLAVSRKIVEEHQGAIDVQSQIGAGSTFTIILPLTQPTEVSKSDSTLAGQAIQ